MIKFQATATIHSITPVINIPSRSGGQDFQKRELILDDSWEKDGTRYLNFILIEFTGDRMAQLDNFQPGQRVVVECVLNGREHNQRIFNSVRGLSVAHYQPQTQQAQAAPAPAPQAGYPQQQYHQQQSQYPQQQYPQQPQQYPQQYPPSTGQYQQPPQMPVGSSPFGGQHNAPGADQLPFPH